MNLLSSASLLVFLDAAKLLSWLTISVQYIDPEEAKGEAVVWETQKGVEGWVRSVEGKEVKK